MEYSFHCLSVFRERNAALTKLIHDIPVSLSGYICIDWTRRHAGCGPVCRHSSKRASVCIHSRVPVRGDFVYVIDGALGRISPFPSLDSLSLWTRLGASMAGWEAARPEGCRWSWLGRWRALAHGTARAGVSSALRRGSASELPWKGLKKKKGNLNVKLYLENHHGRKVRM